MINEKLYKFLKWCDLVAIPALLTLYGVIGNVCNIPCTEQVLTIGAAVDVCLGTLLGISSNVYQNKNKENDDE